MTRQSLRTALRLALGVLCLASAAGAQEPPDIGYVFPAGIRQGTAGQVTVGGQRLDGVREAYVSGAGVKARVIEYAKPLTQQQIARLREQLNELRKRARGEGTDERDSSTTPLEPVGGYDLNSMSRQEIQAVIDRYRDPKRQQNSQIAETVILELALEADAEPGVRELRLRTERGLSNPINFHVGGFAEVIEVERGSDRQALPIGAELPVVVNGQILPGDVDRFRFPAERGQRLVIAASAQELIPYLADAVPGWFQATLGLFDASGKELAYADDFRFHPDPVLYYEVPETGEYVLEIKDSIYRGREDFVYRITLGELPFVTGIFPLGGPAGELTTVTVDGWNLPSDRLVLDWSDAEPGLKRVAVGTSPRSSNQVPFLVDDLPESLETEPNDEPASARRVPVPGIVNGRIDHPGDRDVFELRGRAGDELVAEVFARRLGSPLDSLLKLFDAKGQQLAANDDHLDPAAGLTTHHADSRLSFTLPARGTYYLQLEDAQSQGERACAYRLRVRPRQPDFELRVVPSSLSVRSGGSAPLTVHALRRDGFEGEIELSLVDGPPGFSLGGALIPAGIDEVRLTLKVPSRVWARPLPLELEGRAVIERETVRHRVQPADDCTQAFITHHLVPAEELLVTVAGRRISRLNVALLSPSPVKLPVGDSAEVRFSTPAAPKVGDYELVLNDAPDGIVIESVRLKKEKATIVLFADDERVDVGQRGNLIIDLYVSKTTMNEDGRARTRRTRIGTFPAVPYEIVPEL